jgi:hypothetical protein
VWQCCCLLNLQSLYRLVSRLYYSIYTDLIKVVSIEFVNVLCFETLRFVDSCLKNTVRVYRVNVGKAHFPPGEFVRANSKKIGTDPTFSNMSSTFEFTIWVNC